MNRLNALTFVAVLAFAALMVTYHVAKSSACEKGGGIYVRTMWSNECIKARCAK